MNTPHLNTIKRYSKDLMAEATRDAPNVTKLISLARTIAKLGEIYSEELAWRQDD